MLDSLPMWAWSFRPSMCDIDRGLSCRAVEGQKVSCQSAAACERARLYKGVIPATCKLEPPCALRAAPCKFVSLCGNINPTVGHCLCTAHADHAADPCTAIIPDTSGTIEVCSCITERPNAQVQTKTPHAGVLTGHTYNMGCPCIVIRAAVWPICDDSSNQMTIGRA